MKILFLVHRSWPYHGGSERYVLEHAVAASEWGHDATICTTDAWDMSVFAGRRGKRISKRSDVYKGVGIIRFPVVNPPGARIARAVLRRLLPCGKDRFYYPNPFVPSLERWLTRDRGFHVVHANAMPFMLYNGWMHARRFGRMLVTVPHTNVGERYRRVDALRYFDGCQPGIFRKSNFVVVQNSHEREIYEGLGVPGERIHLSGSGVDPGEFQEADASAARRRHGLEGPVVLCMTAHSADRGVVYILDAFKSLIRRGMNATLVLAGPILPDARKVLDSRAGEDEELAGRLVVTGYVTNEERVDLLAASDVVLLPSRLDAFGIVVIEAWISGKPVVGCWSGAMPDLVRDGENGFLVSFGDAATLAHRIGLLLGNRELASEMGERGRKTVLANWTWNKVTDRFYRRLAQCSLGRLEP